ncbi:hypothetical protein [Methylomonas sp. CM2]
MSKIYKFPREAITPLPDQRFVWHWYWYWYWKRRVRTAYRMISATTMSF